MGSVLGECGCGGDGVKTGEELRGAVVHVIGLFTEWYSRSEQSGPNHSASCVSVAL
jgi:hypothetical protein